MQYQYIRLRFANYFTILFFFSGLFLTPSVFGQVSGTVFRDYNANGQKDANEPLVAGIVVNAYNTSGVLCATATTAGSTAPNYTLPTTCTGQVRVEFEIPVTNTDPVGPLATVDYPSYAGATYGSSVQFVTVGATNVNFAINTPNDYCETNPQLALTCYENGSGIGNSNAAFITFPYNSTGNTPGPTKDFDAQTLGSVYGVSFQSTKKLVYTSAFLKRHSGLGIRGMDGVYVMDYNTPTPTLVGGFDLQGVIPTNGGAPIDLGSVTRTNVTTAISSGAAGDNELSSDRLEANRDLDAFVKVGTVGFGDIDVSEDNNFLWLVNLNQKALIKVDISTNIAAPGNPNTLPSAKVSQYLISGTGVPGCVNGQLRPFGLEFKYGKGYVGVVCDASGSSTIQRPAELKAYVLSFDPANPTSFTQELSVNLDHAREQAYISGTNGNSGNWQRWMDSNADYGTDSNLLPGLEFVSAPQPLLSDIDITEDGSMVLSFQDRFSHQSGNWNYTPVSGSTSLVRTIAAGDILYAKKNTGAGYTVEPTSTDASPVYPGFLTNDGPNSDGEYFFNDYFVNLGNTAGEGHFEVSLGASAYIQGTKEVVQISFDPEGFFSQGVRFYNIETAENSRNYTVLYSDFGSPVGFGKGSALGDIEVLCSPAPLEIGNRVWTDSNSNGKQDAGEAGIDGVTVKLFEGTTEVGSTTTANGGQYYFTNANVTGGLKSSTAYEIRIGSAQPPLSNLSLTTTDVGTNGSDLIDNDGTTSGLNIIKAFTTGNAGQNNHSYDFGFKPASIDLVLTKTVDSSCVSVAGRTVNFTLKVKNISTTNATGVTVKVTAGTGFSYVSTTPSGVYNSGTGIWTVGAVNAGDSATLVLTVKADSIGVNYCTAEINAADQTDSNSTPNNGVVTEDDIARACVSVPMPLCPNQSYNATLPNGLTGIQWYKNGTPISGATNQVLTISEIGEYTFTANESTCPVQGCCPIKVVTGSCTLPCKPVVCLPVAVVRQ